jgi:hypothetical protein
MGIWRVRSLSGTWPLEDGVRYLIIGTDIKLIDYVTNILRVLDEDTGYWILVIGFKNDYPVSRIQ